LQSPAGPSGDIQQRLQTIALVKPRFSSRQLLWILGGFAAMLILVLAALIIFKIKGAGQPLAEGVVTSDPIGAAVFIDGQQQPGVTPLELKELTCNAEHSVLLVLEGYKPWQKKMTFAARSPAFRIEAKLERLGAGGNPAALTIKVKEAGAEVYFDGVLQGRAPITLPSVASGVPHTLVVKKDGFQDYTAEISDLKPDEKRTFEIELEATRPPSKRGPGDSKRDKKAPKGAKTSSTSPPQDPRPPSYSTTKIQKIGEGPPAKGQD